MFTGKNHKPRPLSHPCYAADACCRLIGCAQAAWSKTCTRFGVWFLNVDVFLVKGGFPFFFRFFGRQHNRFNTRVCIQAVLEVTSRCDGLFCFIEKSEGVAASCKTLESVGLIHISSWLFVETRYPLKHPGLVNLETYSHIPNPTVVLVGLKYF